MKFYDTNAILKNYKSITEPFLISSTTLMELENIKSSFKKDEQTKYSARKAVKFLKSHRDLYTTIVVTNNMIDSIRSFGLPDSPDNEICACASYALKQGYELTFVSDDLCCETIAHDIFKLPIEPCKDMETLYRGFKKFKGNTAEINEYLADPGACGFVENEYILLYNTDTDQESEMRYHDNKFVALKLPAANIIKARNALQRCALDILYNPKITMAAILGYYGSGKTFLSMRMALNDIEKGNYRSILGIREVSGEGKEIGYLPGDAADKTDKFFKPLIQQLDQEELDYESMKQQGTLETEIPYFMKGTTYNNTILLVDEAEDLTEKQIKLIGTRIGENSKIILSGDYKQSVINNTTDNSLVRACNELKGDPEFACIYLEEDVRSYASRRFAGLFERD